MKNSNTVPAPSFSSTYMLTDRMSINGVKSIRYTVIHNGAKVHQETVPVTESYLAKAHDIYRQIRFTPTKSEMIQKLRDRMSVMRKADLMTNCESAKIILKINVMSLEELTAKYKELTDRMDAVMYEDWSRQEAMTEEQYAELAY